MRSFKKIFYIIIGVMVITSLLCYTQNLAVDEKENKNSYASKREQKEIVLLTQKVNHDEAETNTYFDFWDSNSFSYPIERLSFYTLSDYERETVESIVEGEAGNQSLLGRVLVAQCIYNACVQDNLSPSEVKKVYRYEGWSDTIDEETKEAVSIVFDDGTMGVDDNILWFYNPKYSYGKFHNTQRFIIQEGEHKFYAPWKEKI